MLRSILITAATVALLTPALAQDAVSSADRDYLKQDAQGAAYELNLAKAAADKASRSDVKAYAQKVASDHERYNSALQDLGKQLGLELPSDMTTGASVKLTAIKVLSGSAFDSAFLEQMVSINDDDMKDADKEKNTTKSAAIKDFVAKFAAMDQEHEQRAKQLQK